MKVKDNLSINEVSEMIFPYFQSMKDNHTELYEQDRSYWGIPFKDAQSAEEIHQYFLERLWEMVSHSGRFRQRTSVKAERQLMIAKSLYESQKFVVEMFDYNPDDPDTQELINVRFPRYISGETTMHWAFAKLSAQKRWAGEDTYRHELAWNMYSPVYDSTTKALVPRRFLELNPRTVTLCPECHYVVKYNTETISVRYRWSNRNTRVCLNCVILSEGNLTSYYNLQAGAFCEGDVSANFEKVDVTLDQLPIQTVRNLRRFNALGLLDCGVYKVPFNVSTSQHSYTYELNWTNYFMVDGVVKTNAARVVTGVVNDKGDKHSYIAEMGLPIGMELELQARDRADEATIKLLEALHIGFPYGNDKLAKQSKQLAVASYDGSLGSGGVEFKFQPMTMEFMRNLPDEFWGLLKQDWRGFHAKRCGMHLNVSKQAFTRDSMTLWVAWFDTQLKRYNVDNDTYVSLKDIMQRVNVGYARWIPASRDGEWNQYAGDNTIGKASSAVNKMIAGRYFTREAIVNYNHNKRMEVRGFSSHTLKARVMKNIEFMTALHDYVDTLSSTVSVTEFLNMEKQDADMILAHMENSILFYDWLLATRSDKYPYLTEYVESAKIIDKSYRLSPTDDALNYIIERTA